MLSSMCSILFYTVLYILIYFILYFSILIFIPVDTLFYIDFYTR